MNRRWWRQLWLMACLGSLVAEDMSFPADAGVIDVTRAPYLVKGDGRTDATAGIQRALDEHAAGNRIIYLPNGTYRLSGMLRWAEPWKRNILQGQSRAGTILRLADRCPGFQDPARPQALVWTGDGPAQRFRNAIRNLTVHTGTGNPGACGLRFNASNQGSLRDVSIVSGDGAGVIGLDLQFTGEIGPMLVTRVSVDGFDRGIRSNWDTASITFEHIQLRRQRVLGWHNRAQMCFVRDLRSENAVPAIYNEENCDGGFLLVQGDLRGLPGAAARPAIDNRNRLYVRDLVTAGYAQAIRHSDKGRGNEPGVLAASVVEWLSHGSAQSQFPAPSASLRMTVRETPQLPFSPRSTWDGPHRHGGRPGKGNDCTAALQAAIDSGARTIYLPNGTWQLDGEVVLRGSVERLIGGEAWLQGNGRIRIGDGHAPLVVVERLDLAYSGIAIVHAGRRPLLLSSVTTGDPPLRSASTADLYLEDVCAPSVAIAPGQRAWARQLNCEGKMQGTGFPKVLNDGGGLWILGLKTEQAGTIIATRGGGTTELLGAFVYAQAEPKTEPMFTCTDGHHSLAGVQQKSFNNLFYGDLVRETRGGETRTWTRAQGWTGLWCGYGPQAQNAQRLGERDDPLPALAAGAPDADDRGRGDGGGCGGGVLAAILGLGLGSLVWRR